MPSTVATFAASETTMRYRDPYVTEGLNKKAASVNPEGIYRGFSIRGTGSGDRQIIIDADPEKGDSIAVYRTSGGVALTIRRIGPIQVSLTSYVSQDVVIAIFASYAVGANTVAIIRAYTVAEYNAAQEKPYLVVLGTVAVPGVAAAISGTLHYARRVLVWENVSPGMARWSQIVTNGSFEVTNSDVVMTGMSLGWVLTILPGTVVSMFPTQTDARTGNYSLELSHVAAGAAVAVAKQFMQADIVSGSMMRVRFFYKIATTRLTGSPIVGVYLNFIDEVGFNYQKTMLLLQSAELAIGSVDWVEVNETFPVPGTVEGLTGILTRIDSISISFTSASATWTGGFPAVPVRIDDVSIWVEPVYALDSNAEFNQGASPRALGRVEYQLADDLARSKYDFTAETIAQSWPAYVAEQPQTGARAREYKHLEYDPVPHPSTPNQAHPWIKTHGGIDVGHGYADSNELRAPKIVLRGGTSTSFNLMCICITEGASPPYALARIYKDGGNGALLFTHNATSGSGLWASDKTSVGSSQFKHDNTQASFLFKEATGGTWDDNSWDDELYIVPENGTNRLHIEYRPTGSMSTTTAYTPNSLYAENIVKAWGKLTTNGGSSVSIDAGFGLTSATLTSSTVVINLSQTMAENPTLVVTGTSPASTSLLIWGTRSFTTSQIIIAGITQTTTPTTVSINPQTTATTINFVVMARD